MTILVKLIPHRYLLTTSYEDTKVSRIQRQIVSPAALYKLAEQDVLEWYLSIFRQRQIYMTA